jgi:multidrug efflux pump subunit AcrA (membrane-fusion protein)
VVTERISEELRLTGTVAPKRFSLLSAEFEGIVEEVMAEEGDLVAEGQVLLRLRDTATRLRLDQARSEAARSQAVLDELTNGERPEVVEAARAEVEEARAALVLARQQRDRLQDLLDGRTASQSEFDSAAAEFDRATAEVARLQADYERLRNGARAEEVEQARADVQAAEARMAQLEYELGRHTLRAPFAGVIGEKRVDAGQWLGQGAQAFSMAELDPLQLRVLLPDRHFGEVLPGTKVQLTFDALPGRAFEEEVTTRVPLGNAASRTFPLLVDLDNPELLFAPGMLARVAIPVGKRAEEPSLLVHKDAIVRAADGSQDVWVVREEDGKPTAQPVRVSTGRSWRDMVEVTAGELREGERVVVRGNEVLFAGQAVSPREASTRSADEVAQAATAATGATP